MAAESARTRLMATAIDGASKEQLILLVAKLVDGIQALAAKLDADAGVTDTDFAAVFATYVID